jgi:hypothetical protein
LLGVKGGDLEFLCAQTRERGPPLACASIVNAVTSTVCFIMNVNMEGISPDLLKKLIQVLIMHQYCQSWAVLENYNWVL